MKQTTLLSLTAALASAYISYDDPINCQQNEHWVSALPYFSQNDVQPCSYAGTLPSNAAGTHNLFYWLYPSEKPDAPIAIFLNGGPGASSTFANFLMNGPMRIEQTGPGVDDYLVTTTDASWVDAATMIFID
jgi:carboxypeptidase C (cathepsin A)